MTQLYIENIYKYVFIFPFSQVFFAFQISQYFIFPTNFIKMSSKSNNLLATFSPRKLRPNPKKGENIFFSILHIIDYNHYHIL